VDLDEPVQFGHLPVERLEALLVHRVPVHVRVNLYAQRAELLARIVHFGHGGLDVVHRHARHEAREAVRVSGNQLREGLVADPGELGGDLRRT